MEEKIFSSILKTSEFKKDFKEIWKMEDRIRTFFFANYIIDAKRSVMVMEHRYTPNQIGGMMLI